jgi:hypothetical protein
VRPDPPTPADGTCATCGRKRKVNRRSRYGLNEAKHDPFCSTVCCREWHGTQLGKRALR